MKTLHYGEESVSEAVEEVEAQDWAERVYRPDLLEKKETLYKSPGHSMYSAERRTRGHIMQIYKAGSQASQKGPAEWFTGTVRIDPLFTAPDPAFVVGASVTFEPGARTAWHTHPLGQTLIVTAGAGWIQREGGSVEEIFPGDVVWFAPGEKHWHGATATVAMTHIAIQEKKDGKVVDWMEQVSYEQYKR